MKLLFVDGGTLPDYGVLQHEMRSAAAEYVVTRGTRGVGMMSLKFADEAGAQRLILPGCTPLRLARYAEMCAHAGWVVRVLVTDANSDFAHHARRAGLAVRTLSAG